MLDHLLSTVLSGLTGVILLLVIANVRTSKRTFVDVPRIGRSGILGVVDHMKKAREILQEGYSQYKTRMFKVRQMGGYVVYVSGRSLLEELRKAPEDVLSFNAAANETLQTEYTLGETIVTNHYHIPIIQSQLTRNLGALYPDIADEVKAAFGDNVDAKLNGNDWISVPAYDTVMNIVARTSNRIFLGLPICREPEFIKLSIKITLDVMSSAAILKPLPRFLRPFVAKFVNAVPRNIHQARMFIGPLITERRQKLAEFGDNWAEKPNDLLAWLMDAAEGEEQSEVMLVTRIMTLNFAAVHTSSMSFSHVLFHLAANPEYAIPMREEVERAAAQEGWSKTAFGNMLKLDSFVRESLRVNGINSSSMNRFALKPYTFADGTHIPAGASLAVPAAATHMDEENYENAHTFKPFRFAFPTDVEDKEDSTNGDEGKRAKEKTRAYAVSTGPDFVTFGHGQHACPGRFLAVNELKMMLAHILINYDVQFHDGIRPSNIYFGDVVLPNTKAQVMFRKRQT